MAKKKTASYQGVERRRHKVFVTENTEYHFRDGLCIAVRDRQRHAWISDHVALFRSVSGSLKFLSNGAIRPNMGHPRKGEALFFATGGRNLITSTLLEVQRPKKKAVDSYPKGLRKQRTNQLH